MLPQSTPRKRRNSGKINLLISASVHAVIVVALTYFAAREGLLGKQLKKIAVQMVKEKPPEKAKEPEKPKQEQPKVETPKVAQQKPAAAPPPQASPTDTAKAPPPASNLASPPAAPPAAEVSSFVFEGGKAVETTSDPVQLYKGFVEYSIRSKWDRPTDIADNEFVAEVEVSVDKGGRISNPDWKKESPNARWNASVRNALAATPSIGKPPPAKFPGKVVIRFDVQEVPETALK